VNKTLKTLALSYNSLGNISSLEIANSLQINTALSVLLIDDNELDDKVKQKISEYYKHIKINILIL